MKKLKKKKKKRRKRKKKEEEKKSVLWIFFEVKRCASYVIVHAEEFISI